MNSNKNKIKKISKELIKRTLKCKKLFFSFLFVALVFDYFLFPLPAIAQAGNNLSPASNKEMLVKTDQIKADELSQTNKTINLVKPASLPANPEAQVKKVKKAVVTAYNSEVGQCDSDPCTTASGFNVCKHGVEDTVATNSLPFGTKIRMPELFGNRIFTVRDRMNPRYPDRFDVWMKDRQNAIKFGVKTVKIEIIN